MDIADNINEVSVYDLQGEQLGNAFIEPDQGDWFGRFEPASSVKPNGTLRVMSWRQEDDSTVLRTLRLRLRLRCRELLRGGVFR
jgi:hypothetical protein